MHKLAQIIGLTLATVGAVTLNGCSREGPAPLFDVPLDTTGRETVVRFDAPRDHKYMISTKAVLPPSGGKEGSYRFCNDEPAQSDPFCTEIGNTSWALSIVDASDGKPDVWTVSPDGYVVYQRHLWATLGYFNAERGHHYTIAARFTGREPPRRPVNLTATESSAP